jgi:hypothetical protein
MIRRQCAFWPLQSYSPEHRIAAATTRLLRRPVSNGQTSYHGDKDSKLRVLRHVAVVRRVTRSEADRFSAGTNVDNLAAV